MFTPFAFVKTASTGGGPVLWNPSYITTLAWWDASKASSVTLNGSNVSQINDLSGNNYNATQSNASLQPAYTATLNGLKVMTFNGSNNKLELPSIAFPSNYQMSVYIVGQGAATGGYQVLLGLWKSGTDAVAYLSAIAGNNWGLYTGGDVQSNTTLGTSPFLIGAITNNTNSPYAVFDKNGTLYNYPGANPFTGTSVFSSGAIGNDQYGSAFNGYWGEAVVVPQYDGPAARQKMEGYLAWKWGLQANLPNDSPYKNAPPYV